MAEILSGNLKRNSYIDTVVQKAGISGFSGYLEHSSMIWHQIQMAKVGKKDLSVVFLDLGNNAFGSVPYNLLWAAFNFFYIPDTGGRKMVVEKYMQRGGLRQFPLVNRDSGHSGMEW